MSSFADSLASKSESLLERLGNSATLKKETGGSYSPSLGEVRGSSSSSYDVKISPPEPYSSRYIDGTNVLSGDVETLFSSEGLAAEPEVDDRINFDGKDWAVVSVSPIRAQDTDIVYQVQLRP